MPKQAHDEHTKTAPSDERRKAPITEAGAHAPSADHTQGVPSTAALAGHPIHPALVTLPLAFLVGAFGADLGVWWTGDPFWARAALWLTGTGAVLGILATIPGLIDFLTIERARTHRIGWVHALGNAVVLALAVISWLLRRGDPVGAVLPWGLVLSAVITSLLLVTGWAGGELAYRHMIGVTGHDGHAAHEKDRSAEREYTHPGEHGKAGRRPSRIGATHDGRGDHGVGDNGGMPMESNVTGPQLTVVGILTVLAMGGGILFSASYANLRISAPEVEGAIMPPGMIQTWDTPAEAMRDMAAVDPNDVSYTAPVTAQGDQPLEPHLENGVKVFDLEVSVIEWNILSYERVMAYAFNQQIPGPRIRITQGDRVRFHVTNHLPEATTVHWHGLILPNEMDGPAYITQDPIQPGETYTYEFTAQQAGTFFYHSHNEPDRQQGLGMYGALIIDPPDSLVTLQYDLEYTIQLQEWLEVEGYTYPAMFMDGALPNFFTINGKAYPATETIEMKVGQQILIRFIGSHTSFIHPMHIHGGPFVIVATDGNPVPLEAQILKDTVNVGPGERYDVIWEALEPGKWLLHCHIPHHTRNNNVEEEGGGGLMLIINVTP